MAAATGFWSTAEDLTVFGAAHFLGDERLLSDDAERVMQRLESVVTAYGTGIGRYGLGMALTTVGDRHRVGHSGGPSRPHHPDPIDPVDQLVVSVLTNAVDGPAEELATGLVKLVDVALAPRTGMPPVPPDAPPLASFTGRFASPWGIVDIAELGGRLVLVRPTAADPSPQIEELEVVHATTLRVAAQPGFGAPGELLPLERDAAGRVTSIRLAGVTSRPVDEFLRRRSALARTGAGDPAP